MILELIIHFILIFFNNIIVMSKDNYEYINSIYYLWYNQTDTNNKVLLDHYKKSIESRKEMSKMFGNFLINITEKCFDCLDLSSKRNSKFEKRCLNNCVNEKFNTNEIIIKMLRENIDNESLNVEFEKSYYDLSVDEVKKELTKYNIFKDL